jgi:hypothetical protein
VTLNSNKPGEATATIDVDAIEDLPVPRPQHPQAKQQCIGIGVDFPPGKIPHTSYTYGIHDELGDPWDYSVTNSIMVIRAKGCNSRKIHPISKCCTNCNKLTGNGNLQGIIRELKQGLMRIRTYYIIVLEVLLHWLVQRKAGEVKALGLRKLNAHKLAGKVVALDNLKRWVMAVGSGKVEHVNQLVKVNLAQKGGVQNLIELYNQAAQHVYHPQNYTEEDEL